MNVKYASMVFGSVLVALSTGAAVQAGSKLNSNEIIEALESKKAPLTRSIVAPSSTNEGLSKEERQVLKNLKTRGLKIETLREVGTIIDRNKLPSLDIEINFGFNSAEIDPGSLKDLRTLGTALTDSRLAESQILLNGHTDAKGSKDYNLKLSQSRADAVQSFLVSEFSIDPDRIISVGFGEERLKEKDSPTSSVNRRVEIINVGAFNQ